MRTSNKPKYEGVQGRQQMEHPRTDSERGGNCKIGGPAITREEAIIIIERVAHTEAKWPGTEDTLEALDMAVSALRPVSREQVDVVIKSLRLRLENNEEGGVVYIPKFAVMEMIERLEAIENG